MANSKTLEKIKSSLNNLTRRQIAEILCETIKDEDTIAKCARRSLKSLRGSLESWIEDAECEIEFRKTHKYY